MKQDITPIIPQRGSLRPSARPDVVVQRPVAARVPSRGPVSMDGMKSVSTVHKSLLTVQNPKPVQSMQDVRRPVATAASPVTPLVPATPVVAPVAIQPEVQPIQKPVSLLTINEIENMQVEPALTDDAKQLNSFETQTPQGQQLVSSVKEDKPKKRFDFKKHGIIGLAALILIITGYISVDTWLTNRQVQAVITPDSSNVAVQGHSKDNEGKDENPITADTLSNYTVSAEYPRALYINKIGVAARVLPMSINTDGSIQSPLNIFDAGWYTGSVKPGEIGASFIDGHASGATRQGLFGNLDKLVIGDTIDVEKGDGTKLTYKVVHTETVALEGLDMKKVLLPYGNSLKGLNLMTCTGNWIKDKQTFDQRVVVYTELVQ